MVSLTCLLVGANCQQGTGLNWNVWDTRTPLHVVIHLGFFTGRWSQGNILSGQSQFTGLNKHIC